MEGREKSMAGNSSGNGVWMSEGAGSESRKESEAVGGRHEMSSRKEMDGDNDTRGDRECSVGSRHEMNSNKEMSASRAMSSDKVTSGDCNTSSDNGTSGDNDMSASDNSRSNKAAGISAQGTKGAPAYDLLDSQQHLGRDIGASGNNDMSVGNEKAGSSAPGTKGTSSHSLLDSQQHHGRDNGSAHGIQTTTVLDLDKTSWLRSWCSWYLTLSASLLGVQPRTPAAGLVQPGLDPLSAAADGHTSNSLTASSQGLLAVPLPAGLTSRSTAPYFKWFHAAALLECLAVLSCSLNGQQAQAGQQQQALRVEQQALDEQVQTHESEELQQQQQQQQQQPQQLRQCGQQQRLAATNDLLQEQSVTAAGLSLPAGWVSQAACAALGPTSPSRPLPPHQTSQNIPSMEQAHPPDHVVRVLRAAWDVRALLEAWEVRRCFRLAIKTTQRVMPASQGQEVAALVRVVADWAKAVSEAAPGANPDAPDAPDTPNAPSLSGPTPAPAPAAAPAAPAAPAAAPSLSMPTQEAKEGRGAWNGSSSSRKLSLKDLGVTVPDAWQACLAVQLMRMAQGSVACTASEVQDALAAAARLHPHLQLSPACASAVLVRLLRACTISSLTHSSLDVSTSTSLALFGGPAEGGDGAGAGGEQGHLGVLNATPGGLRETIGTQHKGIEQQLQQQQQQQQQLERLGEWLKGSRVMLVLDRSTVPLLQLLQPAAYNQLLVALGGDAAGGVDSGGPKMGDAWAAQRV
ncbi:hypothetical protein DUNSADRAFT_16870 [Dunaliella salina]|uniref:Uncharacterized protein n=1 Tax=Dunaliella salina TaxID=3046 RepID=A0ABQ7G2Q0_DUNSA|nr:hypothetical protein DUNSADRAFT_16870 [Dunaliella salina]|eukprot:KAF5828884.1 hypothetical protein DUNSADRAFT_16870 [Dunaliella salina]